ncbi:DUF4386 domain-containing protein [Lysobacter sp. TY2-98]|uniref:DUF4386 domain-containing protein n=1 Tax=Lysobacter sp. TY2-98 TaxID=2290922 RepID=UPI000E2012F0|nr:DUF4386 domain-containing protein [Lysobacter sp. TY2-98]AXK72134.1 DUF4386 domain-containing protein [Lysobacter sp. TY2-98]
MTTSPQPYARLAGLLYLVIIAAGIFGELAVRGSMVASGDAALTAARIAASPDRWRLGIAIDLLMHVCDVFVMWSLYALFRVVNRRLALLVLLFNLVQTAVLVANKLFLLVPLMLLGDAPYLHGVPATQLQAWSYVAIRLHEHGFGIGLIFFGVVCVLEGHLIRRSGFLPRTIGMLMQVAGVCYLVNSLAQLLAPSLQGVLFPWVMLPVFVAETSFALWLLIRGVDAGGWQRRMDATRP